MQLFKRRNVATVEDDGLPEDDGMADSGYLESQANNMDPLMVRRETFIKLILIKRFLLSTYIHYADAVGCDSTSSVFHQICISVLYRVG